MTRFGVRRQTETTLCYQGCFRRYIENEEIRLGSLGKIRVLVAFLRATADVRSISK